VCSLHDSVSASVVEVFGLVELLLGVSDYHSGSPRLDVGSLQQLRAAAAGVDPGGQPSVVRLSACHLHCTSCLTAPPASLHLLPHCTSCLTAPPASLLATSGEPLCLTAKSSSVHEPSDSMLAVSSGVCTGLTTSSTIQSLCFLCSVIPTQLLHSQYTSIRTND
jgi:hypothetical protein